jgi:hypothetical protein
MQTLMPDLPYGARMLILNCPYYKVEQSKAESNRF